MKLIGNKAEDYLDSPMREYPLPLRALYSIVLGFLYGFTKIMWRWKMENPELLFPKGEEGGYVIICNHTSMAEVPAIMAHAWACGRRVRPIYKSEFNDMPLVGFFFTRFGGIPVERGTADMKSLRYAQHALQRGEDVFIFPEGTRMRGDEPGEMHGGFALMASMGKADIAPMAVCGFCDVTPDGKRLMRPVKCWMRAAEHVSLGDAPKDHKRAARQQWAEDLAIKRMLDTRSALRQEHPGRR